MENTTGTLEDAVRLLDDNEVQTLLQSDDTEIFIEIRREKSIGNEENTAIPVKNIRQDGSKSVSTPKGIDGAPAASATKITIPALDLASVSKHTPPISKSPEARDVTVVMKQVAQYPDGTAKTIVHSESEPAKAKRPSRAKKTTASKTEQPVKQPVTKKQKTGKTVQEQEETVIPTPVDDVDRCDGRSSRKRKATMKPKGGGGMR